MPLNREALLKCYQDNPEPVSWIEIGNPNYKYVKTEKSKLGKIKHTYPGYCETFYVLDAKCGEVIGNLQLTILNSKGQIYHDRCPPIIISTYPSFAIVTQDPIIEKLKQNPQKVLPDLFNHGLLPLHTLTASSISGPIVTPSGSPIRIEIGYTNGNHDDLSLEVEISYDVYSIIDRQLLDAYKTILFDVKDPKIVVQIKQGICSIHQIED